MTGYRKMGNIPEKEAKYNKLDRFTHIEGEQYFGTFTERILAMRDGIIPVSERMKNVFK